MPKFDSQSKKQIFDCNVTGITNDTTRLDETHNLTVIEENKEEKKEQTSEEELSQFYDFHLKNLHLLNNDTPEDWSENKQEELKIGNPSMRQEEEFMEYPFKLSENEELLDD